MSVEKTYTPSKSVITVSGKSFSKDKKGIKQLKDEVFKSLELDWSSIETQVKFIQGKVLTIIDASYSEQVQRKAVKDLINSEFSRSLNWLYDLTHPNIETLDEHRAIQIDVDETLKEAEII